MASAAAGKVVGTARPWRSFRNLKLLLAANEIRRSSSTNQWSMRLCASIRKKSGFCEQGACSECADCSIHTAVVVSDHGNGAIDAVRVRPDAAAARYVLNTTARMERLREKSFMRDVLRRPARKCCEHRQSVGGREPIHLRVAALLETIWKDRPRLCISRGLRWPCEGSTQSRIQRRSVMLQSTTIIASISMPPRRWRRSYCRRTGRQRSIR